jgi:hypothetical protein
VPPNRVFPIGAVLLAAAMSLATPAWSADSASQEKLVAELDAARQDGIAAARETQQRQARLTTLDRELVLLGQDAAARRRGLEESRVEQAHARA